MLGEESAYGALCRLFNDLAFPDVNYEYRLPFRPKHMIQVNVLCFIAVEYNQFLSSFSNHLLTRR
jgi:hypothetical protein